jgi:hypothetical protein
MTLAIVLWIRRIRLAILLWLRESGSTFDLICGRDFNLRLPLVDLNRADDANDFPLERCQSLIIRHLRTGRNESSKYLAWIFLSKIYKRRSERAGRYRDDQTAYLDPSTDILCGFRIFDHGNIVRRNFKEAWQNGEDEE